MESKASRKNPKSRPGKSRPRQNQPEQANQLTSTATTAKEEPKRDDVIIDLDPVSSAPATSIVDMMPNENQQVTQDQVVQNQAVSTGNEEKKTNIFIDIEQPSETTLVVEPPTTIVDGTSDSIQIAADNPLLDSTVASGVSDELSLPDTLTRLTTANGAEVYLLGTAHFSPNSVKDVQRTMRIIKPNILVLELCRERAFMLSLNEADCLEQNRNLTFDKVRAAIAQKGLAQGLIYIMFIKMSASLTEKLGLAPGSEFRAGANEAHQIPGCSIALGDRSLKVTLARAVASVSTWQKIKLIYQVLTNDTGMTQEEVERCKDKDILEQLMQELGVEFPGFKRVILDERNIYLAHSIYHYAQNFETSSGPQKVVAIVGIGHVAGIVEHWGKTKDEDITSLNEIPKTSKTRRFVSKTIKYGSIALLVYIGYRVFIPSSIQSSVIKKLSSGN